MKFVVSGFLVLASTQLMAQTIPQSVFRVGAIGDSISAGFNSLSLGDRKDLSWSTGLRDDLQVKSHAFFLSNLYETEVITKNVAVAGARSNQIDSQLKSMLSFNPDYVTILIGANDACSWNGSEAEQRLVGFERDVGNAIEELVQKNPNIKLLLAAVPDLKRLRDLGIKNGCQRKWDLYGICRQYLGRNSTIAGRNQVVENLNQINEVLRMVSTKWPDHVAFSQATSEFEFEFSDVSTIDCFHPSIAGQNKISEVSFQAYLEHFEF